MFAQSKMWMAVSQAVPSGDAYELAANALNPIAYWRLAETTPTAGSLDETWNGSDGTAPDSSRWSINDSDAEILTSTIEIQSNSMFMEVTHVATGPSVILKLIRQHVGLTGDFDIEVEFTGMTALNNSCYGWFNVNGKYVGPYYDGVSIKFATNLIGHTTAARTSPGGFVRHVRSGSTHTVYYKNLVGDSWSTLATNASASTADTSISLYVYSNSTSGTGTTSLSWDNLTLNSGTLVGFTAIDETGSYDSSYVNGPSVGTTGLVASDSNTAVYFDGTSEYLTNTNIISEVITHTTGSISFFASFPSGGDCRVAFFESGAANNYVVFVINATAATFYFKTGGAAVGVDNFIVSTTAGFSINTTYHVMFVQDATAGVIIYVDGVAKATSTTSGTAGDRWFDDCASIDTMQVQGQNLGSQAYFEGTMDEVLIYDYKVSAAQDLTLYNAST